MFHTPEEVSILFDPRLGGDDAKCSCEGVDRWVLAAGYAFALGYTLSPQCMLSRYLGLNKLGPGGYPRHLCLSFVTVVVPTE